MSDIIAKLSAPFEPDAVSWRVGSTNGDKTQGLALAYLDARDVQDRLNDVCGVEWQVRNPWSSGNKLACEIGIKIGDEWVWRGDGAGDSDVEAEKGAFSDAFKRAAVRWGVGRYLYDLRAPWVKLKAQGRSYVIDPSELPKLRALLSNGQPAPQNDHASDIRESRANSIIAELRDAIDEQALIGVWKFRQSEIMVMPEELREAITRVKDECKAKFTRKAA